MGFLKKLFRLGTNPKKQANPAPVRETINHSKGLGWPVCFLFLLDNSRSMREKDFPPSRIQAACQAFRGVVAYLLDTAPESQVGMGTFSDGFHRCIKPMEVGSNIDRIEKSLEELGEPGWTHMGKGLKGIQKMIRNCPQGSQIVVVVLTDGHHNGNKDPLSIAREIREHGVEVWTIGIGGSQSEVDEQLLRSLASHPEHYFFVGNWEGPEVLRETFGYVTGLYFTG